MRRVWLFVVLVAAVAMTVVLTPAPAAAPPEDPDDDYDETAQRPSQRPESSDPDTPEGGPVADPVADAPVDPDAPVCEWRAVDPGTDSEGRDQRIELLEPHIEATGLTVPPRPTEDHVFEQLWCSQEAPREDGTTQWLEDVRWIDPNAEEGNPAEDLREALYARVAGNLPEPEISANPPLGQSWIVNAPTFVRIDNWEDHPYWDDDGVFRDQECDDDNSDFCSYVEATATMMFDPGDGTDSIECTAPGVLFEGTTNEEVLQLHESPESCSHIYEQRSGVDGRPEEWQGVVQIVWSLDWWDDDGGSGVYDPITHEAELPRDINEVTTVVTD